MPPKKRKMKQPAKKQMYPEPISIMGCNIQMGPSKHEVTPEVAVAAQALARALEANANAASAIAESLRGAPVHFHDATGISVKGTA